MSQGGKNRARRWNGQVGRVACALSKCPAGGWVSAEALAVSLAPLRAVTGAASQGGCGGHTGLSPPRRRFLPPRGTGLLQSCSEAPTGRDRLEGAGR